MANWTHFYLFRIEFLGFRYHGWQKQNDVKSVHQMIDKTFSFIFQHQDFKTLGCGRTDAKVSADDFAFELFTFEPIDPKDFISVFNFNLPGDIRLKSIEEIDASFNIIQHPKTKEYHYTFSIGEKSHPFNAPFIQHIRGELDIEKMMEAAKLYKGLHNFKRFAAKPTDKTIFEREIIDSEIVENKELITSFSNEKTYIFKVKSKGFLRYQVRLMVGALIDVARGEWTINQLSDALSNGDGEPIKHIAPSSGLKLHKIEF